MKKNKSNTLTEALNVFDGEWVVEISAMSFRADKSDKVTGLVSFNWIEEKSFIVRHSKFTDRDFPLGTEIIGFDDTNKNFVVLYSDSKGAFRIYEMTLNDGVWKQWRTSPGFSQRFTGLFSKKNNVITAKWESSKDDINWEHNFDMIFKRKK